jgi:hypothetical protein
MRGQDEEQDGMLSYISTEQRVSADHPLRRVRVLMDEALKQMSPALVTRAITTAPASSSTIQEFPL